MQIVIDIDDDRYQKIMKCKKMGLLLGSLEVTIANGTPLPKGHGRLIDADAYREAWFNSRRFEPMLLLDDAPTVIEADNEVE